MDFRVRGNDRQGSECGAALVMTLALTLPCRCASWVAPSPAEAVDVKRFHPPRAPSLIRRGKKWGMASWKGLEPLTPGLGNRCSILLSYQDVGTVLKCVLRLGQTGPRGWGEDIVIVGYRRFAP
jgi:hypothetical protein